MSDASFANLLGHLEALDAHLITQGSSIPLLLDQVAVKMMGFAPFDVANYVPSSAVPVNVDVPYVEQMDDVMHCTMGNWKGEPTSYRYQWARDGQETGEDSDMLAVAEADVGRTFHCTVTATNAAGSTTAPPSNDVIAG